MINAPPPNPTRAALCDFGGVEERLVIDRLWGEGAGEVWATLTIELPRGEASQELRVLIESAWRGTAPPTAPAGATWALWEREAVECFLVGAGDEYLELEFGPQGHHLGLTLRGVRRPTRWFLPLSYVARREPARLGVTWEVGERWWGEARVHADLLPPPLVDPSGRLSYKIYACACWGPPEARRYATSCDLGGGTPDFHRPSLAPWLTHTPHKTT